MYKVLILNVFYGGISRDEAVNRLNNSVVGDKEVLKMDFGVGLGVY